VAVVGAWVVAVMAVAWVAAAACMEGAWVAAGGMEGEWSAAGGMEAE